MLNWKNNENDAVVDEICIKNEKIKIKFQKNEGFFFGQHSLVEKSPTATDIYIFTFVIYYICRYLHQVEDNLINFSL